MHYTIAGGGFGGIKAALELAKDKANHITLISDRDTFQYYPALYSSATGHSHLESWVPLGEIFAEYNNIHVHIDTLTEIDGDKKFLRGKAGVDYPYEACILGLGSVTTFFGIKGLDTYAYGIKSADEIRRLKQHIYQDIAEKGVLDKEYVIVGGGPTGVELASSLGIYLRRLSRKYSVRSHSVRIRLIEAAPRILPKMSIPTSLRVKKRLEKIGVVVDDGMAVESAASDHLMVSGKRIDTETIIWTSGVANNPFFEANKKWFNFAKNHKVVVDEYLQAYEDVYVIGDNAATPFSGLAQIAVRDGHFVAENLKRKAHGKKILPYDEKFIPAVVIPLGPWWAAMEWRGIRIYGVFGALMRRAADIIGYRDIGLSIFEALGKLRAGEMIEDDYFTPTPRATPRKRRTRRH